MQILLQKFAIKILQGDVDQKLKRKLTPISINPIRVRVTQVGSKD